MKAKHSQNPLILFAEDDDDHYYIGKMALLDTQQNFEVKRVVNGGELIELLKNAPLLPSLIILDLNMPKIDGRKVLEILHSNHKWKKIPVGVLTTSPNTDDKTLCLQKGVKLYFQKPSNYSSLVNIMKELLQLIPLSAQEAS